MPEVFNLVSCCNGRNAVGVQSCVVLQGKEMPEALDKGSQPYSRAFRHREPTVTVRASEGK